MRKPKAAVRRDPDGTRRAILAAALEEYSLHGPAGARVDRIAAAAGVNKRMIYHYFGSKAGLWSGLLDEVWSGEPILSTGSAVSIAEALASGAERIATRPAMTRLLAWEALTAVVDETGSESVRAASWRDRIAHLSAAQLDGRLSQHVDPAQLELALTALLLFPAVFPQIARMITGHSVTDPSFGAARSAFFRLISELLSPVVPPPKPRFRLAAAVTEAKR